MQWNIVNSKESDRQIAPSETSLTVERLIKIEDKNLTVIYMKTIKNDDRFH